MALLKSRKPRDEQPLAAPPAPPSIEALRRRALHRLIGAAVLVLAGVIGFPLVFDNQPRPIPVDLPIVIVDKDKAPPLPEPSGTAKPAATEAKPSASATTEPAAKVAEATPAAIPKPAVDGESAKAVPKSEPAKPAAAPVAEQPAPKPVADKPAAVAQTKTDDAAKATSTEAARARAALEGKALADAKASASAASAAAGSNRFIVQVGAFADSDKVREVRRKVEGAGLKTYTQVVETKDGARTRIRVGPFGEKNEAQQVADKIRKLDLSPSILTL